MTDFEIGRSEKLSGPDVTPQEAAAYLNQSKTFTIAEDIQLGYLKLIAKELQTINVQLSNLAVIATRKTAPRKRRTLKDKAK